MRQFHARPATRLSWVCCLDFSVRAKGAPLRAGGRARQTTQGEKDITGAKRSHSLALRPDRSYPALRFAGGYRRPPGSPAPLAVCVGLVSPTAENWPMRFANLSGTE